ncbi:MAG: flagellar hook-basal body complex protein [Verrucomicrobia bacterium]|nr:flagellar hook-basal body complex protein [Verrucomicrobiota bacterium]
MALLNSFTSGVSAVKTFGKSLEVIGDNIANVNTTGFKGSRMTNQDNFSQTFDAASAGGKNSMQVGGGTSVASISQKFTQGVLSTTGGPADLGIAGPGFFKVTGTAGTFYTRAGDFRLDNEGTLLTNSGLKVDGATTLKDVDSYQITKDGKINTYKDGKMSPAGGGTITLVTFANPNGLKREAGNLFSNLGAAAGEENSGSTVKGDIIQGTLELSNVDLTQEFSDLILAQRAFQAGSRIITVSDSVMEEIVNLKR